MLFKLWSLTMKHNIRSIVLCLCPWPSNIKHKHFEITLLSLYLYILFVIKIWWTYKGNILSCCHWTCNLLFLCILFHMNCETGDRKWETWAASRGNCWEIQCDLEFPEGKRGRWVSWVLSECKRVQVLLLLQGGSPWGFSGGQQIHAWKIYCGFISRWSTPCGGHS